MKRIYILILLLIVSIIITVVYFINQSAKAKKQTEIIQEGNTLQVPADMVGENGEPPGSEGGP